MTAVHAALPANAGPLPAAPVDLNGPGHYLHWGFFQISAANVVVAVAIAAVFVAALVLPFPKGKDGDR
jgi:hypothetical protein